MASLTYFATAGTPASDWYRLDATITSVSASQVVLTNSDGTLTVLTGSGFAGTTGAGGTLTAGTVTQMARTNSTNSVTFAAITGFTYDATVLASHLPEPRLELIFADILAGADTLNGSSGNDFFKGFAGNDTIGGGGGIDTAGYFGSAHTGGISVTLSATSTVTGNATEGTDTLVSVERVVGSNSSTGDTFTATAAFAGSQGTFNDFEGLGGNDTISGNGNTRISYTAASAAVTVDLVAGTATSTAGGDAAAIGTDTFSGVRHVWGSAFDDLIFANDAANQLIGNDGFDFFRPGGGADTINGAAAGQGNMAYDDRDMVSYHNMNGFGRGVIVNLSGTAITIGADTVAANTALDPSGAVDQLIDIERIRGTALADTIRGGDGSNQREELFQGLAGNDTINGGAGIDMVSYVRDGSQGGAGAVIVNLSGFAQAGLAAGTARDGFGNTDTLIGIEGAQGTAGADRFIGNAAANVFRGDGGADTIDGGLGFDLVMMHIDDDVFGGAGTTVNLATGQAVAIGGATQQLTGIEDVTGSMRNDTITGNAGDNKLRGFIGNDSIFGGSGADTINGGQGRDTLSGGLGVDTLSYNYDRTQATYYNTNFPATFTAWGGVTVNLATLTAIGPDGEADVIANDFEAVTGTWRADSLTGNSLANTLTGQAGNDTLDGGDGIDTVSFAVVSGNRGEIVIDGVSGSRPLGVVVDLAAQTVGNDGLGGSDTLISIENVIGSDGNDSLTGNATANVLQGGAGADTLNGAGGADTASYAAAAAAVTVSLATPAANTGEAAGDVLINIEHLTGSGFADTLTGNGFSNNIGGGGGADTLVGGAGADILNGGLGNDVLTGGAGLDSFVFSTALSSATNADVVTDFSITDDTIRLARAVFTALGPVGALSAAELTIGPSATTAAHRIVYDDVTGWLSSDADGSGIGAQVEFAQLATGLGLGAADFVII